MTNGMKTFVTITITLHVFVGLYVHSSSGSAFFLQTNGSADTTAASIHASASAAVIFRLVSHVLCLIGILMAVNLSRLITVRLSTDAYIVKKYEKRNTLQTARSRHAPSITYFLAMYVGIAKVAHNRSAIAKLRIG